MTRGWRRQTNNKVILTHRVRGSDTILSISIYAVRRLSLSQLIDGKWNRRKIYCFLQKFCLLFSFVFIFCIILSLRISFAFIDHCLWVLYHVDVEKHVRERVEKQHWKPRNHVISRIAHFSICCQCIHWLMFMLLLSMCMRHETDIRWRCRCWQLWCMRVTLL